MTKTLTNSREISSHDDYHIVDMHLAWKAVYSRLDNVNFYMCWQVK